MNERVDNLLKKKLRTLESWKIAPKNCLGIV